MKQKRSSIFCHMPGSLANGAIITYYPVYLIAAPTRYLSGNKTGAQAAKQR